MIKDMVPDLVTATHEVFETMVGQPLQHESPVEGEALRPQSNVVACVGMAGSVSGCVAIYSTKDTAFVIAASLLDMPPDEVNGEMVDAIGEIANMVAGSFRTRLTDSGHPCDITVPTVTVGSDFYTSYVKSVERMMCPFTFSNDKGHEIFVELILNQP
jgi:chemotaxis protein CheX